MQNVVAYIRVSTKKQGEKDVSPKAQQDAIETYCNQHNLTVTHYFKDVESGGSTERKGFNDALKALERNNVHGIIAWDITRLYRNVFDSGKLNRLLKKHPTKHLHLVTQTYENNAAGKFTQNIQTAQSEYFLDKVSEDTKRSLDYLTRQGKFCKPAPVGYRDTTTKGIKEHDPTTAPFVKKLFKLYATGKYSLMTLEEEARQWGLKGKRGKPITDTTIERVLKNPFYYGKQDYKGELLPHSSKPLITYKLFQEVQNVMTPKATPKKKKHSHLYRGFLKCSHCGASLLGEVQKGHTYYRCHNKEHKNTIKEETVDVAVLDWLEGITFTEEQYNANLQALKNSQRDFITYIEEQKQGFEKKKEQFEDNLNSLTDKYAEDKIDDETYKKKKEEYTAEIENLNEQIRKNSNNGLAIYDMFFTFLELAKSASQSYKKADKAKKRELLEITLLELKIKDGEVASIQGKSLFEELQKQRKNPNGVVDGARTHNR